MQIVERMAHIRPFLAMDILARAQAMERRGRDVIHLEIGEPDFPSPPAVVEAAAAFLAGGQVRYTPAGGLPELRAAIAAHYGERHGLDIAPRRIVVTPGASGGFLLALGLLVAAGDRVAVADPGYPCYPNFIRLFGGEPVAVPAGAEQGFQWSAEMLEPLWASGLRGVIVASPANPTGALMPAATLAELVEQARTHAGFVVSDEIYHGLEYTGATPSAAQYSEDACVINSFSKYYGMTGWRLGWAVVPEVLADAAERLAQNIFIAPPTLSQVAALASFSPENRAELERRRIELRKRRDFLCAGLEAMGFILPAKPGGAFYIYADCSRLTGDSTEFAADLLESTGVAVTPGRDFGNLQPERYVRLAYTTPIPRLEEGLRRLAGFVNGLKP